jgi:glycosyltransferase involved in cell wall biosynthesis
MKVLQVSTSDLQGGAARAAYRLHRGLLAVQQESLMLVLSRQSQDQSVVAVAAPPRSIALSTIQKRYINQNRTSLSNTSFSLSYPGVDLRHHLEPVDIVNLHWIAYFQSPMTIHHLRMHKPVVWTLHDMWAFTGGCHYTAGCNQYQQACSDCPQLQADSCGLVPAMLQDKLALLQRLVIVTPSQWLADCARKSLVFRHHRIEVIPYGLETDVFTPMEKVTAKRELGIDGGAIALLVGADDGNEQRKGFAELLQALHICRQDSRFQALLAAQKLQLLCFGIPHPKLAELNLPLHSFGRIDSDAHLRKIYAAADLFVLPSLEDNLPNTMLEAMSCGTPVVAFAVGGMIDVVSEATGRAVKDVAAMAAAIVDLLLADEQRQKMGAAARQLMAEHYGLTQQADRYLELYQDLIGKGSDTEEHSPLKDMGEAFERAFYPVAVQVMAEELQESRQQVKREQERSQTELETLRDRITAMETSKFWQLRSHWFQLKRQLGLPSTEE